MLRGGLLRGVLSLLTTLAGWTSAGRVRAWGRGFGILWSRLGGPRSARVSDQLGRAFPEWEAGELRRQARAVFAHLGESLAELILLRTRHRDAMLAQVEVAGLPHLEAARLASPSGGVILLTGHCGNWELAGLALARCGLPVTAVRREQSGAALEAAIDSFRRGPGPGEPADYTFIRRGRAGLPFVRALSEGRVVLVLLDQNVRPSEGPEVRFFGQPARVRSGPIRIAMRRDIPVVPAFTHRQSPGGPHRIEIGAPLSLRAGEDEPENEAAEEQNLQEATRVIEEAIRRTPAQWIWPHRRWRARSDPDRA